MSALDLTKGYWQVPLRPTDKKTAFATLKGLFQFTMMPFGLHAAAATFQRLVDTILQPCKGFILAYLDNIIIYSRTWTEHLVYLQQVFEWLHVAGIRINLWKSKLGFQELKYLGYTVGQGQLMPQRTKVEAILNAARPQTKNHSRRFQGLAGYYSRFIASFATRASSLTDMLGKKQPDKLHWDARAQTAFDDLQQALVCPLPSPVLVSPDFTQPFVVQTNASSTGLGAVLTQVIAVEEHLIVYVSRKLQPTE